MVWRPIFSFTLCILSLSYAAAAIVFIAAAGVVIWMILQGPLQSSQDTTQSDSAQTSAIILPVYDDSFNLVLVNKNRQLKSDFSAQLTEFKGVQIEERILPALEKMLEDAKRDGCHLNVTGGYVDKETQQTQYEQEVQVPAFLRASGSRKNYPGTPDSRLKSQR